MALKDKAEEVAVVDLIMAEMAEQETWETYIPVWHPRNEGEGDGDGGGDGGDGSGGEGDGNGSGDGGDTRTEAERAAQAAVDAAYAKLRDAEKERDRYKADLTKAQRNSMGDLEKAQAEAEDARLEAAALQEKLDKIERDETISEYAKSMKFKNPEKAARFVPADATDAKSIRAALKEATKDIPELVTSGAPPPPVNGGGGDGGSVNSRMNAAIRQAAGRG